jgi:hypothetical protein
VAENPQRRALAAAPWPLHGNIACNRCHRAVPRNQKGGAVMNGDRL